MVADETASDAGPVGVLRLQLIAVAPTTSATASNSNARLLRRGGRFIITVSLLR
jgi:hypothetical protein